MAAKKVAGIVDSKKATEIILSHIELDTAMYKIGHTKASVLLILFNRTLFILGYFLGVLQGWYSR